MSPFAHPALNEIDEIAPLLYAVGSRLEEDPEAWGLLWENELMRALTLIEVPEPYSEFPNCGHRFGPGPMSYLQLLAVSERLARHDPNCILALPTPGMGGFAFSVLGNPEQTRMFFERYSKPRPKRNFFAITEPHVGSDATNGVSVVTGAPEGLRLSAHKKVVGSIPQADLGLIFVKDQRSRSHKLVIADAAILAHMKIGRLAMNGLRGADLGELQVEDLAIPEEAILGHGLNRGLRDGFFAMNEVFERYRPMVITMAAGVARGILEDLAECGVARRHLDHGFIRHAVLLERITQVGIAYQKGTQKGHEISRLKLEAIGFLDEVVQLAFAEMPSNDIAQHARLLKRCRDARAFEYMEGTTNIHILQAFRSYAASA
ncbi:hypothetical protein GOZ89_23975 [Agrobacterium vitis]|uniref:acyl-CoA dehydrogenase family protein n=1 Tax=Agrobacterium vitis TaxID=373 RepID=UPI0012E8AC53|nr:acyl-CoA dehydrogenase family protein [Agrobacterium vitis]MCF1455830.1 acyl-CoA dehydrogenase [Agrobacterium vitis]MVA82474.1 hypothetical protein [Agrobacterium vitis]BCH56770.1 acyl-CoA dehydrogenase [Agrobacterium vitis]